MKPPGEKALTVTEALVALMVILVAIGLLLSVSHVTWTSSLKQSQMTQTLSNMKQLHLATQQMALDGITTGKTNLGLPGDTGGTFSNWTAQIVGGNYLSDHDLCKMLSAPGIVLNPGKIPASNMAAILVYAVKDQSEGNVVFLSTANFTNTPTGGLPPRADAKPYGDNGFIVFRKAGDGAILKPRQVGDTNLIGGFAPLLK